MCARSQRTANTDGTPLAARHSVLGALLGSVTELALSRSLVTLIEQRAASLYPPASNRRCAHTNHAVAKIAGDQS